MTMRALLQIVSFCLILTSSEYVGQDAILSRVFSSFPGESCELVNDSSVYAQQPTATPDSQQTSSQSSTAPVPVPEPSEKALSYYRSGIVLWVVNILWGLLIPALFLFTGFSARV